MPNTVNTKKLEEKRNSFEVQQFKREVETFLKEVDASDEMCYRVRCDLAKKVDSPFYNDYKGNRCCKMSTEEIAKEYVRLLIKYDNINFTKKLLLSLIRQQSQTFRRIYKRSNFQNARKKELKYGVYEHSVPVKYSRDMLLLYIKNKKYKRACEYIDYMSNCFPQIFLTNEENNLINISYKYKMPEKWNWKRDSLFIRYEKAGINEEVYKNDNNISIKR